MPKVKTKKAILVINILMVFFFLLTEIIWFCEKISFSLFSFQITIHQAAYPLGLLIICGIIRLYLSQITFSSIKMKVLPAFKGKALFVSLSFVLIVFTIISFSLYRNFSIERGLVGRYFQTIDFKNPVFSRIDGRINFPYPSLMEVSKTDFSIKWQGYLYIPRKNKYTFYLRSDDGSWLYIDDRLIIDNGGIHIKKQLSATISLNKGFHPIKISYFQKDNNSLLHLLWHPQGRLQSMVPQKYFFPRIPEPQELQRERLASILWGLTKFFWLAALLLLARKIWKDKELKRKYSTPFLLFLIMAVSLLLRLWLLQYPVGFTDSDEAVEGLMAKHILQKGERPILYYELAYMGSLKAHIAALIYAIFGVSVAGLKMVTALFFLGFNLLLFFLAKQIFGEKVALLSALLVALSPLYLSSRSLIATAAYMETLFLGTLLLIIINKLVYKKLDSVRRRQLYCLSGFIAGLSFWLNPLIIYYILTGLIFILLRNRRFFLTKEFALAVFFFVVGCFPLLIWNYNNSWHTLSFLLGGGEMELSQKLINIPYYLLGMLTESLPIIFGVNPIATSYSFIGRFSWLIIGIYFVSFFFVCYQREKGISSILKFSLKETKSIDILIVFVFIVVAIYLISDFAYRFLYPRYLLPLYSALPIFVAFFLLKIKKYSYTLFIFLLLSVLACNLYGNIYFHDQIKRESQRFKSFLGILEEHNFNRVFCGFWDAYKITLSTNEEIICSPKMYDAKLDRYPYYTRLVRNSPNPVIILRIDSERSKILERQLKRKGVSFKKIDYYYSIYHSFSRKFW